MLKRKQKEKEPQYYQSLMNTPVLNYRVYEMSSMEKLLYALIAFVVGAVVGFLFYGGLAKDEFGQSTTLTYVLNIVICILGGIIAVKIFLPVRTEQLAEKRRKDLNRQFRDMLDGLATSIGAGSNMIDALYSVRDDLVLQYDEDACIVQEVDTILHGVQNNIPLEDMLYDFGMRSGIADILSFAEVFKVSYRTGGNMKDVVQRTYTILSDKMEMREDIETVVTSNKTEQNTMLVMPVALVAVIKYMSPDFAANFATVTGVLATTVAVIIFIAAYYVGKNVLEIKV